jgi:hypothetical protein
MAESERPSPEHTSAPVTPTNTGVVIGILTVLLIALGVFFFWRGTGYRDQAGRRPPPPAVDSDSAAKKGG